MYRLIKTVAAAGIILCALLIHGFYVTYRFNADKYLFKWKASDSRYQQFVDELAHQRLRAAVFGRHVLLEGRQIQTYEQALASVKNEHPQSWYGMTPALGEVIRKPSKSDLSRSLWLGVITPISLVLASLILLFWAWWPRRPLKTYQVMNQGSESAVVGGHVEAGTQSNPAALPLVDVLRKQFGPDFPVIRGNATRDDPLVITEPMDYVSIEYVVAKFLMSGYVFKKESQALLNIGGRKIDELVFVMRSPDATEWEGIRHFYFDITVGFNQLAR